MGRLAEIKHKFPMRETVEQYYGDYLKKRRARYDMYLCPFHDDRQASLLVYENKCECRAGCLINGDRQADIFAFIKALFKFTTWTEVEELLDGKEAPKIERKHQPPPERPNRLVWAHVERGLRHQDAALKYFAGRGLHESTVRGFYLGQYVNHPFYVDALNTTFMCKRYTIPDVAFGVVRNIELRRDDEDAQRTLECLPQHLREQAKGDPLDYFFGARYLRVWGGIQKSLIYNVERVMQRVQVDGTWGWFCPDRDYVLLHEGALKALAMEELGYASISGKDAAGLAYLTGVERLYIVQDNEPDKVRPDGSRHNAGREYALRALALSGRRLGHDAFIITPPDGYKGADDAAKAGLAHDWMKSLGIERRIA